MGIILFNSNHAEAHKNTAIKLENGKLIGLPEKYQPAILNMKEAWLQLANIRLNFPPCVKSFFPEPGTYKLVVWASWYHDISVMPPYVEFWIMPNEKKYRYELLFDLDTLAAIDFTKTIYDGNSLKFEPIAIDSACKKSIQPVKIH